VLGIRILDCWAFGPDADGNNIFGWLKIDYTAYKGRKGSANARMAVSRTAEENEIFICLYSKTPDFDLAPAFFRS